MKRLPTRDTPATITIEKDMLRRRKSFYRALFCDDLRIGRHDNDINFYANGALMFWVRKSDCRINSAGD